LREWCNKALVFNNHIYIFGELGKNANAQIWVTDMFGNLLRQNTLKLPTINDAVIFKNKVAITGGNKSNGYVALLKF
jgi:hypothetical protein